MSAPRKKMLERVRAILAKTVENGATEAEALAALEKARELMSAYDIAEAELGNIRESEPATIHKDLANDLYLVKRRLLGAVANFTRCRSWYNTRLGFTAFCGLESDVAFATWLLDVLAAFVLRELKAHQARRRSNGNGNPRIVSVSFVLGCAQRIGERLKKLTPPEQIAVTGNALTISRNALIAEAMEKAGIRIRRTSSARGHRRVDDASHDAGKAAGEAARFDRPVASSGVQRIATRAE